MDKKYDLLRDDTLKVFGIKLYRIRALKSFGDVKKGDLGGYIESESNLSHEGNCWVYDDVKVFGKDCICGDTMLYNKVRINGKARVFGDAEVFGKARISDNARVCD